MICSECRQPIKDGMEISVYQSHFHVDCALKAVKKAREKVGKHVDDSRRSEESDEGRTLITSDAAVN